MSVRVLFFRMVFKHSKSPYAFHPVSKFFLQCCFWNSSSVCFVCVFVLFWSFNFLTVWSDMCRSDCQHWNRQRTEKTTLPFKAWVLLPHLHLQSCHCTARRCRGGHTPARACPWCRASPLERDTISAHARSVGDDVRGWDIAVCAGQWCGGGCQEMDTSCCQSSGDGLPQRWGGKWATSLERDRWLAG